MASAWPSLSYEAWSATCDTLHAHTQVLGKLSVELAPPEPQLQHAALRLTPRGWETNVLPAPDGSGTLAAGLDLRTHEAFVEHSAGGRPDRADAEPAGGGGDARGSGGGGAAGRRGRHQPDAAGGALGGSAGRGPGARDLRSRQRRQLLHGRDPGSARPRCVPVLLSGPLDAGERLVGHVRPRGRALLGQAGRAAAQDFISRNGGDAEQIEIGWWPGDRNYDGAAFFAFAHPAAEGFADAELDPEPAHWDPDLGEFVLDWKDIREAPDPHALALEFAHSAFRHSCDVCGWDPILARTAEGEPPPLH